MAAFDEQPDFFDRKFAATEARGLRIEGKEFNGCVFTGGQFAGAELIRCKFIDCEFEHCDLSNAVVKSSTLRAVKFKDSKLVGVNWTQAAALSHLSFTRCVLNYANFSQLDLRQSRLEECTAWEAEFAQANLTEVSCKGTDFKGSRFLNTNLTKADFRSALNYVIRPGDNLLKKTRFSLPEATSLLYGLDIVLEE